ncbi:MAG: c-type cytochrome [Solirubrobacteraceae bacterium]
MARRVLIAACIVAAASFGAGCGSSGVKLAEDDPHRAGAVMFAERCGACHTLEVAGTQGSTTDVSDREREDGPNFNDRKETVSDVIYAIENGGFSGAIMPENIATGQEARQIAEFLAQYAGKGGTSSEPGAPGADSGTGG